MSLTPIERYQLTLFYRELNTVGNEVEAQLKSILDNIFSENQDKMKFAFSVLQILSESNKDNNHINYLLGLCFYYGMGVANNKKKALEFFTLAANQGYAAAQNHLGFCFYFGIEGVLESDLKTAVELYTKSANQAFSLAQWNLAVAYARGIEGLLTKDLKMAIEFLTLSAKQGNPMAQFTLGRYLIKGKGVEKNKEKGLRLLKRAVEQNYVEALIYMGNIHKDRSKAVSCYAKAANLGSSVGYYRQAVLTNDRKLQLELYTKAAEKGHRLSQFQCGINYHSIGDFEKSLEFFKCAARQGCSTSKHIVSKSYEGSSKLFMNRFKNLAMAIEWNIECSESSTNKLPYWIHLASLYDNGEGVKNLVEALRYNRRILESYYVNDRERNKKEIDILNEKIRTIEKNIVPISNEVLIFFYHNKINPSGSLASIVSYYAYNGEFFSERELQASSDSLARNLSITRDWV